MGSRFRLFAIICAVFIPLVISIYIPQFGSAQPENAVPLLPERGIISLQTNSEKRVILFRDSVAKFRTMLLAPIASWIEADLFRARIFSALDYSWDYGTTWQQLSLQNPENTALGENNSLVVKSDNVAKGGFPFGNSKTLSQEKDSERLAYKILWNMASVARSTQALGLDIRYAWVGSHNVLREGRAFLFRSANKSLISSIYEGDSSEIDTFEFFKFVEPAAVSGYTSVGVRFAGNEEDKLIHYSPVIDSQRELLSSNRGDGIIDGLISFDDLFVFSQKIESVKARVVEQKTMLLAFPSLVAELPHASESLFPGLANLEEGGVNDSYPSIGGKHQLKDGRPVSVLWNYDVGAFRQHTPWLPLTMYMVPREVWILELFPRDPYYPEGKQILVVDKESMLPFYKLVHDHSGELVKTLVAAWGYSTLEVPKKSEKEENEEIAPATAFPSFLLAVDRSARNATVISMHKAQIYQKNPATKNSSLANLLSIPKRESIEGEDDEAVE